MKSIIKVLCGMCIAMNLTAFAADKADTEIVMQEFMVPASDPGIQLYVRNKRLKGLTRFAPEKILLYVHGSTYPAETSFDLNLNGMSWMDYIAQHGYDVYMVELRGYGKSSRPAEMSQPAGQNAPIVRTATAVKDVGSAVDFILKRTGAPKLNLLGWSWGTSTMAWYTTQHNDKVNKLVLYAPQWLRRDRALTDDGGPLGAYRVVSMDSAKERWMKGVPEDKQETLIPAGWFEQWAKATLANDPIGSKQSKPALYAPSGTVQDSREYWAAGKPLYDPGQIRVPTFLVHAEWDSDLPSYMLYAYFAKLTNVPYKRYAEIGEGTHSLLMEKNRMQLFQAVQQFLDEDIRPNL
ncbi:MAG TPA: alpha/beta fold hydrolase [Janthinobacterium sp.]|jgi:pimeloyl-ACP methyl ester carboxylesterase|nr:alpha/beta fold hydrolase [Janthinobacterium sp.]